MPGLRDILDAATPICECGHLWGDHDKYGCRFMPAGGCSCERLPNEAGEQLAALAPELAALCLDMGEALQASYRGPAGWDENKDALLARLDQLCVREEQA